MGQQTAGRRVKSNSAKEPTVKIPISHYDALQAKIAELEALCKECVDRLESPNTWNAIWADSYLHRDLKKQCKGDTNG